MPPEQYERIKRRMVAGWGGYPLVGTAEQIVDELGRLSRAGLDGIVLSWSTTVERCGNGWRSSCR